VPVLLFIAGVFAGSTIAQDKLDEEAKKRIIKKVEESLDKSLKELEKEIKEMVKKEVERFKDTKTDEKGFDIGVEEGKLSDEDRKKLKLEKDVGIKIVGVKKDSPAEKAGIKKDDVIIEVAGKKATSEVFSNALKGLKPGDKLKLKIFRDKSEKKIEIEFKK
jgi:S1-C subfamily serine protease